MNIRQGTRIAFMGAGGTGKTTSAKFISNELKIPLIKSASRTVYEKRNLTEEKVSKMSPIEKLELQTEIFNAKIELDKQFNYITDRTILDHYCYCLAYCADFMNNDQFVYFEETVRTLMKSTYSKLYYFPWGYWTPKSDGVRQDLLAWQSEIDAIMVGYIFRWDLPATSVPQIKGPEYRNNFILKTIRGETNAL